MDESSMNLNGTNLSKKRLERVSDYLRRLVDDGQAAGAGALINRNGVTAYRRSFGMRDLAKGLPMENDSIYRIYSMTKTITVAAALTLYEQGWFKLADPISAFLPAFTEAHVALHDERGHVKLVPAERPITFEHLFTMTAGIPYPGSETYPGRFLAKVHEQAASDAASGRPWDTARMIEAIAQAPLCFHPGEYWIYGLCHDILGRLIEIISGMRFSQYLSRTIFEPLGMRDTGFYTPVEKQDRLAKAYHFTHTGLVELVGLSTDPGQASPPAFESGGGGLASTLDDVERYALMLLNNGRFNGERILSRKTIELMRRSHVAPSQLNGFGFPSMAGYGYGLGVRVMQDTAAAGLNGSIGEWAWDGMLGTWYCVDPDEDLAAVFLIQRSPGAPEDLPKRFAQTVYAAIDD
jgi:CubicO group peptidase (beta-lactamase class C family)